MHYFKGFDKDLKCRDFQYEIGKSYSVERAELCKEGFHACTNPQDVYKYYDPGQSRYCEVALDGVTKETTGTSEDSKVAATKITILKEFSIVEFTFLCDEYAKEHGTSKEHNTGVRSSAANTGVRSSAVNTGYGSSAANTGYYSSAANTGNRSSAANTGHCSSAANTGYCSSAANTGDRSSAANTGLCSSAANTGDRSSAANTGERSVAVVVGSCSSVEVSGKDSLAVAFGPDSKAKGALGDFLVLTEWENGTLINLERVKIDGSLIKENTFYKLINASFVEA